jgi:hypothetical protein
MKYYAVATLKRGAIDPPERLSPWIEYAIFDAECAAGLKGHRPSQKLRSSGCGKQKNIDQTSAGNGERHESLRTLRITARARLQEEPK